MDISYFMTWFISKVIEIFTYTYETLNDIEFAGTSLLKVIIFINIIIPFLYLVLTIPNGANTAYNRGYKESRKKERKKSK